MIDELIVGQTYKLASGHEMKVIKFIPKNTRDMYSVNGYEIEVGGKTFVHSESYLKHLNYWEDKKDD